MYQLLKKNSVRTRIDTLQSEYITYTKIILVFAVHYHIISEEIEVTTATT